MDYPQRDVFYDQLKGIAIFGVVFIHSLWLIAGSHNAVLLMADIFRLAVPIFIVMFSFFLEKAIQKREYKDFIFKRLLSLAYPFLFWSGLYFILSVDIAEITESPSKIITKHFLGYGWAGQYFFILCFQILAIFPVIRLFTNNKKMFPAFTFFITLGIFYYLTYYDNNLPTIIAKISDRAIFYWLPYICLGILLANTTITIGNKIYLAFISFALLVPLENLLFINREDVFSPYTLISVLVSTYAVTTSLVLLKPKISGVTGRILSLLGKRSMAIFVMNPLLINLLGFILNRNGEYNEITNFLRTFFVVTIVCLLSLLIAQLLKNTPLRKVVNE